MSELENKPPVSGPKDGKVSAKEMMTEDDRILALDADLNHRRKCHQPAFLKAWLYNFIYLSELEKRGMKHHLDECLGKDFYDHLKYRSWFGYDYDQPEKQKAVILLLRYQVKVYEEMVRQVYRESKLESMGVSFGEVAGSILVSVIARYKMSSSTARPGKLMARRIDQSITSSIRGSEREPFMDIVHRAILQSCMGPEVLRELPLSESASFTKTLGGKSLKRQLDQRFNQLREDRTKGLRRALNWVFKRREWARLERDLAYYKRAYKTQ